MTINHPRTITRIWKIMETFQKKLVPLKAARNLPDSPKYSFDDAMEQGQEGNGKPATRNNNSPA